MSQAGLEAILKRSPVVPVLIIDDADDAVPLARALVKGGLTTLEVTLRTSAALEAVRRIAREVPEAVVGVGTVTKRTQVDEAQRAGATFAVSPGATRTLLDAMASLPIPLLPGIATASEAMELLERGMSFAKLFPAENVGGVGLLNALHSPLPGLRFCPTGGIDVEKAKAYLALPNVICIGGSWMAPRPLLAAKDWAQVEVLARGAAALRG